MVGLLESLFPGLCNSTFQVTSPRSRRYNCIAWAAGDTSDWWWLTWDPLDDVPFWPVRIPRVETIPAFVAVFMSLGYVACDGETPEPGQEKVALFADVNNIPTHAARQLSNGRWTSKLGKAEDIEHELHALEGDIYGTVALVMKRPRAE